MEKRPKVSIIIPVFNVEKYIRRCLDSVINQTLSDIEIIVVNDDTKDNSMDIVREYNDPRIKIYEKNNEGLGLTRNYGIEHSNGEYIAFLDSDDFIEKDFYEKLYNNIIRNNTDAVVGNIKLFNNGKISQKDKIVFKEPIINAKKYMYNLLHVQDKSDYGKEYMGMCVWRVLYKSDIIKNNNIRFESERTFISEDILFNIDYCMKSQNISFQEDAYYFYCYNENSLTKTYKKDRFEKDIVLYQEIIRRVKLYNEYNINVERGINSLFLEYVRGAIKQEICNSNKSKDEIYKQIEYIVNNENVKKAVSNIEGDVLKKKIINICIKLKFKKILIKIYEQRV